jgi:dipeptidase E
VKLLLTSAGFTTELITNKCIELVGKPADQINVTVINEGYAVEAGDHTWVVDELVLLRGTFGGTVELVNLLALDIETVKNRISVADLIYVVGGNTDYLMHVFEKTGFTKLLPELLKSKVYVGSSAGSMVMCQRVSSDAYQEIYGEGDTFGIDRYLGLVDIAIKPHLNSPDWPNNREHKLLEVTKRFPGTLFGLSDTSAIEILDNEMFVIGEDWLRIFDGELKNDAIGQIDKGIR